MKTLLILFRFLFILGLSSSPLYAVHLHGHITNYDGKELKLFCISNPITHESKTIATAKVDSSGHFIFDFQADTLRTYYIDLGTRQAQIILGPEQSFRFECPAYQQLSSAQQLNPYFEKENILIYNDSINDINYAITELEIQIAIWLQQVLNSGNPEQSARELLDTLEQHKFYLEEQYAKDYLHYKSDFFIQISQANNGSIVKEKLLRHHNPSLLHPAFWELIDREYNQVFSAPDGSFLIEISDAIISQKLPDNFIKSIASKLKITNHELASALCIKGFYEAAIKAPNYEVQIIPLLESLHQQIDSKILKDLCLSTIKKMETLCIGKAAPYYELYTPKGKKVPTVLKRKYVLLAFVNTNIYACQRHLRLLEKYKNSFKRDLEIVVIACHQDRAQLERYLSRNEYQKIFFTLWEDNQQLLDDYEVKALPSYYLIAPNGELIYAPLSSPDQMMLEQLNNSIR